MTPLETPTKDQIRDRIIDATSRLLSEGGVDAVTTRAVAIEAGVQAPTIYRLFGDKDGLLSEVAQHVFATYIAEKATVAHTGDPVADLRAGWDSQLGFGLANPAIYGLVGQDNTSAATEVGIDILTERVQRVAAVGRLRVPVQRAVNMIHAAGGGTIASLIATPEADRDPGLSDAVYDALTAAILTDAPTTTALDAAQTAAITLQSNLPSLLSLSQAERALLHEWLTRIAN